MRIKVVGKRENYVSTACLSRCRWYGVGCGGRVDENGVRLCGARSCGAAGHTVCGAACAWALCVANVVCTSKL